MELHYSTALKSINPEFSKNHPKIPRYSQPLGDGFIFLRPRDRYPQLVANFGPVATGLLTNLHLTKVRRLYDPLHQGQVVVRQSEIPQSGDCSAKVRLLTLIYAH